MTIPVAIVTGDTALAECAALLRHDAMWHAGRVSSKSRLEDHVERCFRGASNISEATGSNDLAQFCPAGLRAECGADLLRQ